MPVNDSTLLDQSFSLPYPRAPSLPVFPPHRYPLSSILPNALNTTSRQTSTAFASTFLPHNGEQRQEDYDPAHRQLHHTFPPHELHHTGLIFYPQFLISDPCQCPRQRSRAQNLIFRFLQNRTRVEIWLYDNTDTRIQGCIIVRIRLSPIPSFFLNDHLITNNTSLNYTLHFPFAGLRRVHESCSR